MTNPSSQIQAVTMMGWRGGAVTDIVVSNASMTSVNGSYRKCERPHDGVSMYYKQDEPPSPGMVYAIFRAPIDADDARAAGRRWYLGKVQDWRYKKGSTSSIPDEEEIYYCTVAPVGLSEQELLNGDQSDWNVPVCYEWRSITHDDDISNDNTIAIDYCYGNPPVVKVWLVDLTTANTEDTAMDRINIEERLLKFRPFENRALMMALVQARRVRLHFQEDMSEDCAVCLDPLKNDNHKGAVVGQIGGCNHKFHIHCLDQALSGNLKCPICRGEI